MYSQEISASRFVELCLCVVVINNNLTPLPHTHTHHSPSNFTNNLFLYTTRNSHAIFWSRRCDNLRLTKLSSVLLQSTDQHHHFHCIVPEEESRVYT